MINRKAEIKNTKDMKVVFMGTPDFALPSLEALHNEGYDIRAVVTRPDRPRGRGQKLGISPVKNKALELGLNIIQPLKMNEETLLKCLKEIEPDFIVVVAFGRILPEEIIKMPRYGCINVHASLLPAYRGAAPIHRALVNGDEFTGVTTMKMDKGLDTGDIILQDTVNISSDMNCGELQELLAMRGAELLICTLRGIYSGDLTPEKQDESKASYAVPLRKADEFIRWEQSVFEVFNQIRGMNPWPGSYTLFQDKILKIRQAQIWNETGVYQEPGTVLEIIKGKGFTVQTGHGIIFITKVQPQGKSTMDANSFVNGYGLKKGYVFNVRQ